MTWGGGRTWHGLDNINAWWIFTDGRVSLHWHSYSKHKVCFSVSMGYPHIARWYLTDSIRPSIHLLNLTVTPSLANTYRHQVPHCRWQATMTSNYFQVKIWHQSPLSYSQHADEIIRQTQSFTIKASRWYLKRSSPNGFVSVSVWCFLGAT